MINSGMHTRKLKVGNKVRSYDFPNRKDCFIEGVILRVPRENGIHWRFGIDRNGLCKIKTTKRVMEGRDLGITEDMTTTFPVSGVIMEYQERIEVI